MTLITENKMLGLSLKSIYRNIISLRYLKEPDALNKLHNQIYDPSYEGEAQNISS